MTKVTASGKVPENDLNAPTPTDRLLADGQKADHWVLSNDERDKGFVRPVRRSYRHVGIAGPNYPLRDLTDRERDLYGDEFVKFEQYPDEMKPRKGRYWTRRQLDSIGKGCGTVTTMGTSIAETYARSPHFYGSTFCCGCRAYFEVGKDGEFVWDGSSDRVGT